MGVARSGKFQANYHASSYENTDHRAREMAQWAKCLPCMRKNLNIVDPQQPLATLALGAERQTSLRVHWLGSLTELVNSRLQ